MAPGRFDAENEKKMLKWIAKEHIIILYEKLLRVANGPRPFGGGQEDII